MEFEAPAGATISVLGIRSCPQVPVPAIRVPLCGELAGNKMTLHETVSLMYRSPELKTVIPVIPYGPRTNAFLPDQT